MRKRSSNCLRRLECAEKCLTTFFFLPPLRFCSPSSLSPVSLRVGAHVSILPFPPVFSRKKKNGVAAVVWRYTDLRPAFLFTTKSQFHDTRGTFFFLCSPPISPLLSNSFPHNTPYGDFTNGCFTCFYIFLRGVGGLTPRVVTFFQTYSAAHAKLRPTVLATQRHCCCCLRVALPTADDGPPAVRGACTWQPKYERFAE
jgi:hypothetical protein